VRFHMYISLCTCVAFVLSVSVCAPSPLFVVNFTVAYCRVGHDVAVCLCL